MNVDHLLESLRAQEGFAENVGMVLTHTGVVRGWSRQNRQGVTAVEVRPDENVIAGLIWEFESRPGVFRVLVRAESGRKEPGDLLLTLVVAGDVRETVIPALAELLDRVKAEAISKREILA